MTPSLRRSLGRGANWRNDEATTSVDFKVMGFADGTSAWTAMPQSQETASLVGKVLGDRGEK
eukprot:702018-Pyramimonas_sp.AAC.1